MLNTKLLFTASWKKSSPPHAGTEVQGFCNNIEELQKEIANRDQMDSERPVGALKILPDAIVIDTSFLSIDEALQKILDIIGEI